MHENGKQVQVTGFSHSFSQITDKNVIELEDEASVETILEKDQDVSPYYMFVIEPLGVPGTPQSWVWAVGT